MADHFPTGAASPAPTPAPCARCPQNFPLPAPSEALEYFDRLAVGGMKERRTACPAVPACDKPCLRTAPPAAVADAHPGTAGDPVQLHAQAHNALRMVLHHLRQPVANVAGARSKARAALAALRGLDLALSAEG